jgi:hypothetical protein
MVAEVEVEVEEVGLAAEVWEVEVLGEEVGDTEDGAEEVGVMEEVGVTEGMVGGIMRFIIQIIYAMIL